MHSAFLPLAGGSDQPWKIMPPTHACKCGKQSGDKQTSMTAVFLDKKTKNKKGEREREREEEEEEKGESREKRW